MFIKNSIRKAFIDLIPIDELLQIIIHRGAFIGILWTKKLLRFLFLKAFNDFTNIKELLQIWFR